MVKATYGTGGFILLNTGPTPVRSRHRLVTTIAYQWQGTRHYALEGSIFVVGAAVKWLRDALGIIASSANAGELAAQADPEQPIYFVPAFSGLGAPYWNPSARGTITGLTLGTTRKELARAVLESVGYQTRDLLEAMYADAGELGAQGSKPVIRVDGGMSASDWTMQFLADVLDVQVDRPTIRETTALGVALLAGWQAGVYSAPDSFSRTWRLDRTFRPAMSEFQPAPSLRGLARCDGAHPVGIGTIVRQARIGGCDDAKSIQRVRALHALKRRFELTALNVKWQFPLRSYRPEHRQTTACSDSVRRYPAACKARSHPSAPRRKRARRRQRSRPR